MTCRTAYPDPHIASAARMHDYWLGGRDHRQVDRKAADRAATKCPDIVQVVRSHRAFLVRAVRFMTRQGVRQFLDLGSGIPTAPNTHQVARETMPDARVVYVDNDPLVYRHFLDHISEPGVAAAYASLRYPSRILHDPAVQGLISWDEPVGVLMVSVLHYLPDEDDPDGIIAAFRWILPPGSFLALSHASAERTGLSGLDCFRSLSGQALPLALPRSAQRIEGFFAGLDLVEPGVVDVARWQASAAPAPLRPGQMATRLRSLAGVGRVPAAPVLP